MFIKKVINNICFLTIISNVISKNLITSMDEEEYKKLCEEGDPIKCYEVSMQTIKNNEFILVEEIEKIYDEEEKESLREFNSILSDHWYNAGQIEYFGIVKKKPNIAEGFSKFLISAFYGNPKSLYKLYILIESDIIKFIIETKEFENIKENSISSSNLNYIFNTTNTNFSLNFNYDDDYEKNSIAIQFLYSSALFKYQPAMTTLAYKFYKGYGVSRSCDAALRYYKEASTQNVKEITSRKKPNFYEKINIATYEYVGHKFSNEIMDIDDIIDYFKVEAQNGQINYIQQLGQRYLYGQGIVQDFNQAFYYFQIGSRLNDSTCIYYLGEMYLNGWGVEKNYSEAFRLFSQSMGMNNSKAWNALGYMYYYGLGVEKNIKRAYDYFKISFTKGEESDAYYDMVTLLSESNGKIEVDFPNAYKYANFIAAKGHTFGTHFFGMMNEYQLGSIVKTCEITVEFFKQVSERNLPGKRKFDSAIKFYKEGLYKISALLYIELAEEGFEFGQINAGIILKNNDIFINNSFNKFLSFKYFKMAYRAKNIFATLMMADFYHYGFGELQKNSTKAHKLYTKVIQSGTENSFYVSQAYFNIGQMIHKGDGIEKNITKALRYYNQSASYEPYAVYPSLVMKYLALIETSDLSELLGTAFSSFILILTSPGWVLYGIICFFIFYMLFFISLYLQKD